MTSGTSKTRSAVGWLFWKWEPSTLKEWRQSVCLIDKFLVHNQIILNQAKAKLTNCLTTEAFFGNEGVNQRIQDALRRTDQEWRGLEEVREELKIHEAIAHFVDKMGASEKELTALLGHNGISDFGKLELYKRMHWNEYRKAKKRLEVFKGSHQALVVRLEACLDQKHKKAHEKLSFLVY